MAIATSDMGLWPYVEVCIFNLEEIMSDVKYSMWNVHAQVKTDIGFGGYVHKSKNIIATDVEDAIATFKRKYPDSIINSVSHRGKIDLFTYGSL